ncbi:6-pyruvoyl-tetrahydropterin synthase-related protein [Clostridium sp.]|uniref:6-pyruvoyl-tetrahydropterin synthase-related protein n=1 Tax=Clostridium sp. TaxID=1506 RepID=UPI0026DD440D|nr:6-pyruvoyl-tetrahydropterin synthase-related protein [Clostridium sp.]MDO5040444.1 hypothetical protein [Clostridium sp.]
MIRKGKTYNIYLILIILTIITIIPLFINPVIRGDDYYFHLLRIADIKNSITYGHIPVNIMPDSLYGYGYANGIFYPDLLLYIPAFLNFIGINLRISYGIFLSLCTLASTFTMFICIKKISNSKNIALYSTVIYIFAQYKITDLYFRAAVGEYISFIFIPIILLGVYELLYRDYKKWYILTAGISGIILSHLLSVFLVIIMCILIYIINIKKIIKDPKRILYSLVSAIITLLITAYTWIPIIEQMILSKFNIQESKPFAYDRSVSINDILTFNRNSRFFVGIILVILSLLYIILIIKKKNNLFVLTCFLVGGLSLILTIKTPFLKEICNHFTLFNNIQFAWRMGLISTPLLSFVSGYSINSIFKEKRKYFIIITIVLFSILNLIIYNKYYIRKNVDFNKFSTKYSEFIGAGKEYLPEGASIEKIKKRGNIVTSNDKNFRYSNYIKKGPYISLYYKVSRKDSYIDLPLLYYKGYNFKVVSIDGTKTEYGQVENNKDMYVRVNIGDIKEGKLVVDYSGTNLMKLGYFITMFTLICLVIYFRKINKCYK